MKVSGGQFDWTISAQKFRNYTELSEKSVKIFDMKQVRLESCCITDLLLIMVNLHIPYK